MDKNAIKKYAVWARRELISRVSQKALQYEIENGKPMNATADSVHGRLLTPVEKKQRQALIAQINAKGFEEVVEEVAYTWFNRFSALRFMEVNGYLPTRIRVFTDEENAFKPQILTEAIHMELDGLDMNKVFELKQKDKTDELYRYLLVTQCNALSPILPGMFQRIEDYTELLLPDNLLRKGSVVEQMISLIPEEDWTDQVQIIGWLYQYYISEKKDEVFGRPAGTKIKKEDIPAATQLFTPDWIVRYMVENSLGRLWVEGHPNEELKAQWKYYLEEAEQEPDVQAHLADVHKEYMTMNPEEITVIDPCCGSGHILAYMFDVLMQIYASYGYTSREAVARIVRNNIYGLDIDDRAAQLAYFAVMMKARQYDRRFFSHIVQPNIFSIQESNGLDRNALDYFVNGNVTLQNAMNSIIKELHDAKEYGSILNITPVDFAALYSRFDEVYDEFCLERDIVLNALLPLVQVAEVMSRKYDVVVTNPPYMGSSGMNAALSNYIKTHYSDFKADFFSIFIAKCSYFLKEHGFCGMFSPYVWMFIQSYEKLRKYILDTMTIESLIQFEYSAFEEATVPVCTYILCKTNLNKIGNYIRLSNFIGGMKIQEKRTLEAISNRHCGYFYTQKPSNYSKIDGTPIAYWLSEQMYNVFSKGKPLETFGPVRSGLQTSDNKRFLRLWFEVKAQNIAFDCNTHEESKQRPEKWYPHTKGGEFRKWYGNLDYVLNWKNDGAELYKFAASLYGSPTRIIKSTELYFQPYITWSHTTSKKQFAARNITKGMIFNVESPALYARTNPEYFIALLNSKPATKVFQAKNETFHFLAGDAAKMPVIYEDREIIHSYTKECIEISKQDWDSFELSWDFQRHPLVSTKKEWEGQRGSQFSVTRLAKFSLLEWHYKQWEQTCQSRFDALKENEEELNRIFIDIYGLQDELTSEVADKDVTVRKADLGRDIRSFISYAVGCMFGRYSLDLSGLAYAGGEWSEVYRKSVLGDGNGNAITFGGIQISTSKDYDQIKVGEQWIDAQYPADGDNIIPICDDEYFGDRDIVGRFIKFVETVYGSNTLDENLKFIADALGGKGQPKDVIRDYFRNDFYADHCSTYSVTGSGKRPIYWLFDSGKKGGFKALIYMHRYQPDTIARIRTDYVHEQQARYRTAIADLEQRITSAPTGERVKLNKRLAVLKDQAAEIHAYEEKIHHLADQMIPIDLDDGVKVNYAKFQDVLAKIK